MYERYDTMFWMMRLLGVAAVAIGVVLWVRDANVPTYARQGINLLRGPYLLSAGVGVFFTGVFGGLLTCLARDTRGIMTLIESEIARRR